MEHVRPALQLLCFLAGLAGVAAIPGPSAAAEGLRSAYQVGQDGSQSGVRNIEGIRIVFWHRYYGRPVYRCRQFSSQCSYVRPALRYGYYWSTSFKADLYQSTRPQPKAAIRFRRYKVRSGISGSENFPGPAKTGGRIHGGPMQPVVERSGGFARIDAPGHAARWVRADVLPAEK